MYTYLGPHPCPGPTVWYLAKTSVTLEVQHYLVARTPQTAIILLHTTKDKVKFLCLRITQRIASIINISPSDHCICFRDSSPGQRYPASGLLRWLLTSATTGCRMAPLGPGPLLQMFQNHGPSHRHSPPMRNSPRRPLHTRLQEKTSNLGW